jgi:dihydroflavonol-4-reductase
VSILVTGATGFTGSHLAKALAERGQAVRGLVRSVSLGRTSSFESLGIEIAHGDVTDRDSLNLACRDIDTVYHIAAMYRTAGQRDSVYRHVNVGGTKNLLEAAQAAGVRRFVHCSTGGVHGDIKSPPATEDSPLSPGDIYQSTKLEAEKLARDFGRQNDLEVVIARPMAIYGPGDTRFLKMFRGIANRRFPVLGSGTIFYHLTYIDDLVEGLCLCGEISRAVGRTYLLAGPLYTTLNDLISVIADELGVPPPTWHLPVWPFWMAGAVCEAISIPLGLEPPLYRRRVDFFTKSRAFDTTRARTELGYEPRIDLQAGIHMTAAWYRAQGWL